MKHYEYVVVNKRGNYRRDVPTDGSKFYTTYGPLSKAYFYGTREDAKFDCQKGDKVKQLTFVWDGKV